MTSAHHDEWALAMIHVQKEGLQRHITWDSDFMSLALAQLRRETEGNGRTNG